MDKLSDLLLRYRSNFVEEYNVKSCFLIHLLIVFLFDWWLWILFVIIGIQSAPDIGGEIFIRAFIPIILLHVFLELIIRAYISSGRIARTELDERHIAKFGKMKGKLNTNCDGCRKKFDAISNYNMAHEYHLEHNLKVLRETYGGIFCSDECWEVSEEIKKIKASELRSIIRSKAEKRLYGKVKTKKKRVPLSKALRDRVYRKYENQCMICSQKQGLHIHHKDHDPKNNAMRNLLLLCGVCHKKIHMKVR